MDNVLTYTTDKMHHAPGNGISRVKKMPQTVSTVTVPCASNNADSCV